MRLSVNSTSAPVPKRPSFLVIEASHDEAEIELSSGWSVVVEKRQDPPVDELVSAIRQLETKYLC